jgi:predicted amidohydrolase YtcJ
VNRVVPIRDRRWVIEHIGILSAEEIGRIRDLGVVLTTHTNRYIYKEGAIFRAQVGSNAEDTIVPLRRLKEAGVHVALATDNVPPTLFLPIWQAVARVDRSTSRVIAPGSVSRAPTPEPRPWRCRRIRGGPKARSSRHRRSGRAVGDP